MPHLPQRWKHAHLGVSEFTMDIALRLGSHGTHTLNHTSRSARLSPFGNTSAQNMPPTLTFAPL